MHSLNLFEIMIKMMMVSDDMLLLSAMLSLLLSLNPKLF